VDAFVKASDLVHMTADIVHINGTVKNGADTGRILVNAVEEIIVTGVIDSLANIELNAGVDSAWSEEKLLSGNILVSELSGGNIFVIEAGKLDSSGDAILQAGGNTQVKGASEIQNGTKPLYLPVIKTETIYVDVITGYNQVENGTITVSKVYWLPATPVVEQTGMDEIKIGVEFHTMDVTLTQDGYYNPNAPLVEKFREYFVEEVDYRNEEIVWGTCAAPANDATFKELNDEQRTIVLNELGYKPVYDFSYANPKVHKTIDGVPTENDWTPEWKNNPELTYLIDVAGWNDKYIRMPEGAHEDVLRVVTQGEPDQWDEHVGEYRDYANVLYTQKESTHEDSEQTYYKEIDNDNSRASWEVTYHSDGEREFFIKDGRDNGSSVFMDREPTWHTQSQSNVTNERDNLTVYYKRCDVNAPGDYWYDMGSITDKTELSSSSKKVGEAYDKKFNVTVYWDAVTIGFDTGESGGDEAGATAWAGISGDINKRDYYSYDADMAGKLSVGLSIWSGILSSNETSIHLEGYICETDDHVGYYSYNDSGNIKILYINKSVNFPVSIFPLSSIFSFAFIVTVSKESSSPIKTASAPAVIVILLVSSSLATVILLVLAIVTVSSE